MDLKTIQQLQSEVKTLLELMGTPFVEPLVEVGEGDVVKVELKRKEEEDNNLGILIGNHGETLRALEYTIALIVNKDKEKWYRVEVDLDGYRKHREEELKGLARRMAEKATFLRETVELRPMAPADRRIIHMALADDASVETESAGNGRGRHVVIKPVAE